MSISARIPARVFTALKYTIWFDAICIFIALIVSILAIIRYSGNFSYPVWILSLWAIVLVLLSIICIIHMCAYVPAVYRFDIHKTGGMIGAAYLLGSIAVLIGAPVQFFSHMYGWLSVELLIIFVTLIIADTFYGMSRISEVRRQRDLTY